MATRLTYRDGVKRKLLALDEEGYGDFGFTDAELDTFIELTVARLYPALYKRVSATSQATVKYGTNGFAYVTTSFADRVYLVEDATELTPVGGWMPRSDKLLHIDDTTTSVNLYYHDAYTLPIDDVADTGIPEVWTPVIVLGALVEALEARHDTGERPDPANGHPEMSVAERLQARFDATVRDLAMVLPAVQF